MLAWIDLEATSLLTTAHVLEVAAIVTDDQLQEVDRFHRVIYWDGADGLSGLDADSPDEVVAEAALARIELARIDLVVARLHARNGLWAASYASPYLLPEVDDELAAFLARTSRGADGSTAQIAGSSIWFDRGLMAVSLPLALKQLHYRTVDVTTLNEMARRFWPSLLAGIPQKREIHRAMPDVEDSLALGRYYAERISNSLLSEGAL